MGKTGRREGAVTDNQNNATGHTLFTLTEERQAVRLHVPPLKGEKKEKNETNIY